MFSMRYFTVCTDIHLLVSGVPPAIVDPTQEYCATVRPPTHRALKDQNVEDHDSGERPPRAGASQQGPAQKPSLQATSPSGRPKRHRKRKRRRDRKVFASDGQIRTPVGDEVLPPPAIETRFSMTGTTPASRQGVFAALDLGTNNCRLLVAVPTAPGQFRVVDAFSRIVRLGEGLSANGRLADAAMDRAVEALSVCAAKLASKPIRRARLIATEACRSAENGEHFLRRVKTETGLDLEIIDRMTEARLAVSGCESLIERGTEGVVLFDIGGGSSEIALIDLSKGRRGRLSSHIVAWTSLPVGVVSLAERFGGRVVGRDTFDAMVDAVAQLIADFNGRDRLGGVAQTERFHLLGTSGTVTTLAGVHLDLPRYERRRVDGLWMDNESVDRMIERLLGWDFEQRVKNPCIGADRADLVLAGCAILEAIRRVWPSQRLRVADRGLREGVLAELMVDEGVWRRDKRNARP